MSEFALEPWEVPPHVDASKKPVRADFAPVEWSGEKTFVSALGMRLQSREVVAFFHPINVEANFAVLKGQALCPFSPQLDSGKLERIVRKAIKGDEFSFGRLFHIEGQTCLLRANETAWVAPRKQQFDSVFSFPFDVLTEPSSRVFDWLQTQWKTSDSEVRFSWEWNRKTSTERHTFLEEHVPRWRELFDVMRAAAIVAGLPESATWILDHVDTHNHSLELLARLKPWRELLITHFLPCAPFPDSAPECLRDYFRFISNHVSVQGEESTQHERIEGHLRLREWLQHNAPDRMDLLPS